MAATDVSAHATRWLAHAPAQKAAEPVADRVSTLRAQGRNHFTKLAWPGSKHEAWQNTSLKRIKDLDLAPGQAPDDGLSQVDRYLAAHPWDGSRLVFVNGHLAHTHLRDADAQALTVVALAKATPEAGLPLLGTLSADTTQPFAALNSAYLRDGAVITLAQDASLQAPLQVLFLSVAQGRHWMAHPRVLVVAKSGSQATLFEQHVSLDGAPQQHLVNGVTECHIEALATLDYTILQDADLAALQFNQWMAKVAEHGTARCAVVNTGSTLARQEMHVQLAGKHATCNLMGLNLAKGEQHMDTQVTVEHQATDGASTQLFKSLLDDHATSVFSGRVLVHQHAIKTWAQQMSRNLLLSKHATAYTRPQLEILADDVRCTHGATVGQLQEDAVFYLRSRGLDEATTRRLLTYANACEALGEIRHPSIHALCDARVRSELALEAMASTLGETP